MTPTDAVRVIGLTHLLQPPLTLLLASERGLRLRAELATPNPLGAAVLQNMAFAAVALPTSLGVLLAYHAAEALRAGAAQSLAGLLALFWCWRLVRQVTVLRAAWPRRQPLNRWLERALIGIFFIQGPVLGCLMALGHSR